MAQFKIKLLTPQIDISTDTVSFLETNISEFYKQENNEAKSFTNKQFTYCYTFNEKFSSHINGQKELNFSMTQNIWLDSEQTLNPFVSQIKNGTQILLIDQYDNEYFFTVKDIKYTLKESNVVYDYSCQDSFTYQHIRQNNGYTIDNNPESDDFIGAKPIDWWVKNKIKPECHIPYTYLSLEDGLYLSKSTGNLTYFDKNTKLDDVKKIIKPVYLLDNTLTPQFEAYPEYYEAFPFSISGGNASSALIALGEEIGLMLNYKEQNVIIDGRRSDVFVRYFWFEPKKHEQTSNLKYSPKINIQSFGLSHGGSSLTTILNIDSNNIGDELITLIPEIPPFFSTVFSSTTWDKSVFSDGFFTSMCQDKRFFSLNGQYSNQGFTYSLDLKERYSKGESFYDEEYIYLFLYNGIDDETTKYLQIPEYYNKIALFDEEEITSMFINGNYYTSKTTKMEFGIYEYNEETSSGTFTTYNNTYSLLSKEMLGSTQENCYLRVKLGFSSSNIPLIKDSKVLLRFYRDVTSEELDFAYIADSCPWLENRLIDFSYFLKQNIISPAEYKVLLNIIKNDLRIVNGKLLYYSNEYYKAVQQKTKILANLLSTLDSLGAAFNSDVVESYREKGSFEDPVYFKQAYEVYRTSYTQSNQKTPIINYNELLTEYLNKYFQAQQRFLKNIYYFRQYFNQNIEMSTTEDIFTAKKIIEFTSLRDSQKDPKIEIIGGEDGDTYKIKRYLSFAQKPTYVKINKSFDLYDPIYFTPTVKIYNKDKTTESIIVDTFNYKEFHTNQVNKNDIERCDSTIGYDISQIYYKLLFVGDKNSSDGSEITWPSTFTDANNNVWYKYKQDESKVWYGSALPDSVWGTTSKPWPETIQYNSYTLKQGFVEVSYQDIINEHIYKKLYNNNALKLFYHNSNTLRDVYSVSGGWWNSTTIQENMLKFKPQIFHAIINEKTDISKNFKNFFKAVDNNNIKTDDEKKEMVEYYKYKFPITEVIYTGPNYVKKEYRWNDKTLEFQPANSKGNTYSEYRQYLIDTVINNKQIKYEIKSPFSSSEYVSHSIPIVNLENENNYFRRINKPGKYVEDGRTLSIWTIVNSGNDSQNLSWEWVDSAWETEGANHRDFAGNAYGTSYRGYYDFNVVNYAKTASSFHEWNTLKKQREDAEDEIADIKITKNSRESGWISSQYEDDSEYYIHIKKHKDFKDYFDYYSKIALTYTAALQLKLSRNKTLKYKDKFLRVMTGSDKVDTSYNYKILSLRNLFNTGNDISTILTNGCFSAILYYFVNQAATTLDISDVENRNITWSTYFGGSFTYNNFVFTSISPDIQFVILREEPFIEEPIFHSIDWSNGYLINTKRYSLYNGGKFFNADGTEYKPTSCSDLVEGLYKTVKEDKGFVKIDDQTPVVFKNADNATQDTRTKFFKDKDDGTFERVYTIEQIKDLEEFYYVLSDKNEINTLSNIWDFKKLKVFYHQEYYTRDANNNFILDSSKNKSFTKEAYCDFNFSPSSSTIVIKYTDDEKRLFTRECTLTTTEGEKINNTTNGNFWSLYHNREDCPQLFEKAAIIEAELTQYWQQAYSASLYCEYFLPSAWQPRTEGGVNYFSDNVVTYKQIKTTDANGDIKITKGEATLSNKYLPEVDIYHNGLTVKLPKYSLQFVDAVDDDVSFTLASTELKNHPSFISMCSVLNENMDNIAVINYNNVLLSDFGKTTYYYVSNEKSGTKWQDFIQKHGKETLIFENFSGLHVMTYRTLKNQFTDKSSSTYEECKEQQLSIWNNLYKKFPGVLLEDSFSNPQASSSLELYTLAKTAFKDKQEPERSYSISLINAYNTLMVRNIHTDSNDLSWNKYNGQELKIGESILVDAEEYYGSLDDIYQSLTQYLFISDISYDLRKDSDIQVTVNSIKYEDKLIQRLVKLIK